MPFTIPGYLFHKVFSLECISLQGSPYLCAKIDSLAGRVEILRGERDRLLKDGSIAGRRAGGLNV